MKRGGPRPADRRSIWAERPQTSLHQAATLLQLLRPALGVVAEGTIAGYLLRSGLLGAGVAGALLAVIFWWREIYWPGKEPRQ
jgi:hypothetical protein